MRLIISLIVIAAAAYIGYIVYQERFASKPADDATAESSPVTGSEAPTQPPPAFQSKIEIPPGPPGEKHLAPPGIYYMLERVSIEHATGVAAVVPGEQVKLMQRKAGGTIKVTSGKYDFEVKETQVTNDLDVAREVERQYVLTHPVPVVR